jgi:DNA invertase Pin-like site-specific DNA recombinase
MNTFPGPDQDDSTMPRRAYSYQRCSSARQQFGDSFRRQEQVISEMAARVCEQENAILDDTLHFRDVGVSGRTGKNRTVGRLGEFLRLVEAGRISRGSILIFENLDRMSREAVPSAMKVFLGLLEAGITIWTARPERRYTMASVSNLAGIIEPLIEMVRAHEESERKAGMIRESWQEARRQARENGTPYPGKRPPWIRKGPEGFEVIPERAAVVRRLFDLCARMGYGQAILELECDGIRTFGDSGKWSIQYVKLLVKGRTALGEYQPTRRDERGRYVPDGPPILGYYPAIVEEADWLKAQAGIATRNGKRGRPAHRQFNCFVGLATDADTGRPVHLTSAFANGKKYSYLRATPSRGIALRYDLFERAVLNALSVLTPADVLPKGKEADKREKRIAELTAELVRRDCRAAEIQQSLEDPDCASAVKALAKALATVQAEKGEIARELDRLKLDSLTGRAEALAEVQTVADLMAEATAEQKPALGRRILAALPSVIEGIWVQQQKLSHRRSFVHVQIWLRSGSAITFHLALCNPRGALAWDLSGHDLRTGPYRPAGREGTKANRAGLPLAAQA